MRFSAFARHWALLAALCLYAALALPDLALPGLHYDEALEAATPAALLLAGQRFPIVNNGWLDLGGLHLPLMVQNHIGALQVYLALPFVAALGPTVFALRLMTVLIGALTLVGVYALVAQLGGRVAAGAAVLWLAAFPSFVFWSRQGVFVTNVSPGLAAWACAAAVRWWDGAVRGERTTRWALATGLLAGLAAYAKISAGWLVTGGLGVVALHALLARRWPGRWREWLWAAGAFVLGMLPFIAYNLITGFKTAGVVSSSAEATYLGTSNRDMLANLGVRIGQFADVITSGQHLWYLGGVFANGLALVSVVVGLVVLVASVVANRGRTWLRELLLPMLALACLLQSCFTISALWYTHFAIAVWLPAAIVGVAAGVAWRFLARFRGRWLAPLLALAFALAVVLPQTNASLAYLGALRATGGFSFHSTAISDVSRFLDTRPEPVVALDWGMSTQIEYLTGGRKRVEELYGFSSATPQAFAAELQARFGRGELYLTHVAGEEAFPRRQAFLDAVAAAHMHAEQVNISVRRDGLPLIEVWKVTPGE